MSSVVSCITTLIFKVNSCSCQAYAKAAPYPFANIVAQEIFEARLVPSDTDFKIFRDFGKIPGSLTRAVILSIWNLVLDKFEIIYIPLQHFQALTWLTSKMDTSITQNTMILTKFLWQLFSELVITCSL